MPAMSRPRAQTDDPVDGPLSHLGIAAVRTALLRWYDAHARTLPWRPPMGVRADPYRVWLSEVMLQQTTVAAVGPYYTAFLEAFPTVQALAAAPREDVLRRWAGLGYYSRARNLHAAAQVLAATIPTDEPGWRALPGVGPYTAAAIAAIAFGRPANVVDGNVERVMARLFAVETPLPDAKSALAQYAARFIADERPGDWAQALMDLGAMVCTPRAPRCGACPVAFACAAFARGAPETFPRKRSKAPRPQRRGVAFRLTRNGDMLLVRRPEKGLLGGMSALPGTPWREAPWSKEEALQHVPAPAEWRSIGALRHVFTHFALTLEVWAGEGDAEGRWTPVAELASAGLPTVFRKAALMR